MIADRAWVARNLGFNPALTTAPESTFAFKKAVQPGATSEDFEREIIDFDSEAPEGMAFLAFTSATGLSRFTDIPWPKGLEPKTGAKPTGRSNSVLPHADVLVVTWAVNDAMMSSKAAMLFVSCSCPVKSCCTPD